MGLMREGREEHSRGREKPGEFSGSQNGCRRRERGPDEAGEVTSGLCWTREAGAMIDHLRVSSSVNLESRNLDFKTLLKHHLYFKRGSLFCKPMSAQLKTQKHSLLWYLSMACPSPARSPSSMKGRSACGTAKRSCSPTLYPI